MGTRSLTVFQDDEGKDLAVLYRQCHGKLDEHGKELKEFLYKHKIVNNLKLKPNETLATTFNGMGCLAAATVAHFKKNIGEVYLVPPETRFYGEEYIYTIYQKKNKIYCMVYKTINIFSNPGDEDKKLYNGPIDGMPIEEENL